MGHVRLFRHIDIQYIDNFSISPQQYKLYIFQSRPNRYIYSDHALVSIHIPPPSNTSIICINIRTLGPSIIFYFSIFRWCFENRLFSILWREIRENKGREQRQRTTNTHIQSSYSWFIWFEKENWTHREKKESNGEQERKRELPKMRYRIIWKETVGKLFIVLIYRK